MVFGGRMFAAVLFTFSNWSYKAICLKLVCVILLNVHLFSAVEPKSSFL